MATTHSAYRERVHNALGRWPELAWLNRFLQTPKPSTVRDETIAQILDLHDTHFTTSGEEASATSLSQALDVEQTGRLRIVLISHGDSWDVDRDIVDVVCSKYSLDPRFVAKHFDYPWIRYEGNCPPDLFKAIERVDDDSYTNKYTWDLGGEMQIAPRALKNRDLYRADHNTLFDELGRLLALQREIEIFLLKFDQNGIEQSDWPIPIQRQLSGLIDDVKNLLSFYRAEDASSASDYLGDLIQAQVDDAKEAKRTSAKLGLLSQLAYIFLPLQVTVSALGMNLKAFGTGNVELQSFFVILMVIATLSFVPMLSPLLSKLPGKRISDIRDIKRYSPRLAFLFGWFCLCHGSFTNQQAMGLRHKV
ncbi:MAG: hypothetical protein OHK93_004446 [Ramalina farinacea]|uniref:Uncharacterized protein n=1 Tax=Ramalina farinacea TaxID=258253 RepID=A0AA43QW29_9LECA|nr:hypothetical protein [Ramalina farinacea]